MKRYSFCLAVLIAAALFPAPAHASTIYQAFLDGPSESPPQPSPGTGFAIVDFDIATHSMHVTVTFSDLLAPTTASHIHAATAEPGMGTAIVATTMPSFPGFPLGVTSGFFDNTFDMSLASSYNPAFIAAHGGTVAGAEAALAESLEDGTAYYNIHTTFAPGGEIRGFLQPVPEPASLTLLGIGLAGMAGYAWRRRKPSAV
jgi:CHRD domain/PEP-CTERM motif